MKVFEGCGEGGNNLVNEGMNRYVWLEVVERIGVNGWDGLSNWYIGVCF